MTQTLARHGYGSYTRGCRCEECCTAKREYQRSFRNNWRDRRLRQQALGETGGRNLIDGITHGYSGYTEYSCRCSVCTAAKVAACRRTRAANPGRIGSSAAGSVSPD